MPMKIPYSIFVFLPLAGYVFYKYIDGPCALQASYNIGIYEQKYTDETKRIINTPYSFQIDGNFVDGLYGHIINNSDIEYIDSSNIRQHLSGSCKGVHACVNTVSNRLHEKLQYVLKYEKQRRQCRTLYGIVNNMAWSFRSSIKSWVKVRIRSCQK